MSDLFWLSDAQMARHESQHADRAARKTLGSRPGGVHPDFRRYIFELEERNRRPEASADLLGEMDVVPDIAMRVEQIMKPDARTLREEALEDDMMLLD